MHVFGQLVKHGPLGTIQNGECEVGLERDREPHFMCMCIPIPSSDRQVGISMHIELFN